MHPYYLLSFVIVNVFMMLEIGRHSPAGFIEKYSPSERLFLFGINFACGLSALLFARQEYHANLPQGSTGVLLFAFVCAGCFAGFWTSLFLLASFIFEDDEQSR